MKRRTVVTTASFVLFVLLMSCFSTGAYAHRVSLDGAASTLQNSQTAASTSQLLMQQSRILSTLQAYASVHHLSVVLRRNANGSTTISLVPQRNIPGPRGPRGFRGAKGAK